MLANLRGSRPARDERSADDGKHAEVRSGELLHVGPSLTLESEILFERPPPHRM